MRLRLALVASALLAAGCSGGGTYNEPADLAKEASTIKQGAPSARPLNRRVRVTKPPGPRQAGGEENRSPVGA